jgi:hypothetical protein
LEVGVTAVNTRHQNRKRVPAEAGDLVAFPRRTYKVSRDIREDFVSSRMPVTVVDRLETVEIDDDQNATGFVTLGACQDPPQD